MTNMPTFDSQNYLFPSQNSPWSEIISKYLNGNDEHQMIDHKDLIDLDFFCQENEEPFSTDFKSRKHHHHHHRKHKQKQSPPYRHIVMQKKSSSRGKVSLPSSFQYPSSQLSGKNVTSTSFFNQQGLEPVPVLTPAPQGLMWAEPTTVTSAVPPHAMIIPANDSILAQPTPCYLAVPLPATSAAYPVVVSGHTTSISSSQIGPHREELSQGDSVADHCNSACADLDSKEDEDLLLSGQVEDIFGDANDINSEDAEEKFQELFETERKRTRKISDQSHMTN